MNESNLKSLEEYPELVLIKIISFLNVKERLKVKSISKYFNFLIEKFFPLKSLCIYQEAYPFGIRWPFSDDEIKEQNKVYVTKEEFGNINLNKGPFKQLERLYVYYLEGCKKEISDFSSEKLKIFAVYSSLEFKIHDDQRLLFKNLNVLSIEGIPSNCFYYLDLPNLKKLQITKYTKVKLKNPEKLKSLKCEVFSLEKFGLHLNGLKNLICQDIKFPFSLDNLPSLECLEIYPSKNYPEIIELLKGINRQNLEIYLYGLNIKNRDISKLLNPNSPLEFTGGYDRRLFLTATFLKNIVANNYSEIKKPFHWSFKLCYSDFTESFTIPSQNFQKLFPRIGLLDIKNVSNLLGLVTFLKGYNCLDFLNLHDNCLDQKFLDDNVQLLISVRYLHIYNYTKRINFRFLSKLKHLRVLRFVHYFTIDGFEEMQNFNHSLRIIFSDVLRWEFIIKRAKGDYYGLILTREDVCFKYKNVCKLLDRVANHEIYKNHLI